jgi:hypothetical protein
MDEQDRTASLMTPAKLAQVKRRGASPAAWLNQMAADAGHTHVKRLGELCRDLQMQAGHRDFSPLGRELGRLAEVLPRLDFGLLQSKGLLARLKGKHRTAGAEFAGQYERIDEAAQALADSTKLLRQAQGEQAGGTDLTLLEFSVEFQALEKIIDQGARWLQDMRNQLKVRQAEEHDEAAQRQIQDDETRCELLVARLKALRALSSAAQQVHQQAQATAARRAGLVQMLQQALALDLKDWRSRVSTLASAAAADGGGAAGLNLENPMESHRDLQLCVKQVIADCGQLQAHEAALAEALAALGEQLQAAA